MIPDWMKRKRNSSSSACFLGLITKQTIFSICLIKPTKIHVFARLNVVWNAASTKLNFAALAKKWGSPLVMYSSKPTKPQTILMKGLKIISTQITPKTLKNMWANAALRACVLAVRAAILDVTVVPMFSPITKAIP